MNKSRTYKIVEWIAKIWSLLSILFIVVFFLGYLFMDNEVSSGQSPDILTFVFFPVGVLIGLILAWKFKLIGGYVSVLSIIAFHLFIDPEITIMIELLAFPGLIFLILGITEKRNN